MEGGMCVGVGSWGYHTFTGEGRNVVLEDDRDAVEGSAGSDRAAFEVELSGLLERTGVRFDICTESRPLKIHFLDPCEIGLPPEITTSLFCSVRRKVWVINLP